MIGFFFVVLFSASSIAFAGGCFSKASDCCGVVVLKTALTLKLVEVVPDYRDQGQTNYQDLGSIQQADEGGAGSS